MDVTESNILTPSPPPLPFTHVSQFRTIHWQNVELKKTPTVKNVDGQNVKRKSVEGERKKRRLGQKIEDNNVDGGGGQKDGK